MSILCITAVFDILKHKIPNLLLMILLIINLLSGEIIFNLNKVTFEGTLQRIGCLAVIFAILYPFFAIGALGAGDVKLILVTVVRMEKPLLFVLVVFAIATAESVIKILCIGNVKVRIAHLLDYFKTIVRSKTVIPYEDFSLSSDAKLDHSIHLSIPVLLAAICFCIGSHF
jgi:prepilin peptidase CpaA